MVRRKASSSFVVSGRAAALLLAAVMPLLGGCQSALTRPFREATPAERAAERAAAEQEASDAARAKKANLTAEEKISLADQLRRSGRVDKAALAYLSAYERDPENPVPQERIGFLQLTRQPVAAEKIFRDLLKDVPNRASAHAGLGLAQYAQGDLKGARKALQRAVELEPDDILALNTLAVVHDLEGQHQQAQDYYQQMLALNPDDAGVANNLGVSLMLLGKFAEAEAALRHAVDISPKHRAGWNNLGLALGRQELYEEAIVAFRKGSDKQGAHNNLGYVYYLNGRYDEAIAEYEAALLEGGPATPTIVKNLDQAVEARDDRR